ncbi:MAG: Gfo/Idh/MocA family oxidoreductase [Bacteroidota bacterium]
MKLIGLVGCGNWGTNILRDLLRLHCAVYVVDIDSKARMRASGNGAMKAFSSIDDLPACDGYVVAVPIPDLTKESVRLLKFKKPIFAEKTLCLSLEDFDLLYISGGSDYIFAMHKWHYHPGIEALRSVVQSGRIGELEVLSVTRHAWVDDFHCGDVFWTQVVHDLTIVKHLLGYIPDKVRAIKVCMNEDGLPVSFSAMIGDRPTVVISTSGRHYEKISGVSIQGKKGSAGLYNAYDDHIKIRDERGEEKISIDTTFPLYLELKEFVEYLSGGPRPRCGLQDAKEVTEAILLLRKSAGLKH